jgi:flagellar FliL protein
MTLLPDETDESEPGDSDAAEAKPRPNRRKLIILAAAAAVLLLMGGGAAAFFFGLFDGEHAAATPQAATAAQPPTFFALPDLVVTLNAGDRRTRYLKTRVSLELASAKDVSQMELLVPRIVDYCQTFLRELRPEELRGSAAIVRMRDELLKRVNAAVAPIVVHEILFTDLMVE